jgi:hypothetical protein
MGWSLRADTTADTGAWPFAVGVEMAKDPSPLKATIRLAEPTQYAYTIGLAHRAAGMLHFLKG